MIIVFLYCCETIASDDWWILVGIHHLELQKLCKTESFYDCVVWCDCCVLKRYMIFN